MILIYNKKNNFIFQNLFFLIKSLSLYMIFKKLLNCKYIINILNDTKSYFT